MMKNNNKGMGKLVIMKSYSKIKINKIKIVRMRIVKNSKNKYVQILE